MRYEHVMKLEAVGTRQNAYLTLAVRRRLVERRHSGARRRRTAVSSIRRGFELYECLLFENVSSTDNNNNNNNNTGNNNNTRGNIYGAVVMTRAISRVHRVHLTNVGQIHNR